MTSEVAVHHYGDAGLLVEMAGADRDTRWLGGQVLAEQLWSRRPAGMLDMVASFDTVFVAFDPVVTSHDLLTRQIYVLAASEPQVRPSKTFYVPVIYGGQFGPDLAAVGIELGMTEHELIELHAATSWLIRLRAGPSGTPMMDGGTWPKPIARNPAPRLRVPAGSVAVSGHQSAIYAGPSPGGWRLIGRTPVQLADTRRDDIAPYKPGDRLKLVPIGHERWDDFAGTLHDLAAELVREFGTP